jgi:hypothetical protein
MIADALEAMAARLKAAWPKATDVTGQSLGIAVDELPAFALAAELRETTSHAMHAGEGFRFTATYDVLLQLWASPPRGVEEGIMIEAGLSGARAIVEPDGTLGGLVYEVAHDALDVTHETGEERRARVDVAFVVTLHEVMTDAEVPDGLGLF